MSLRGVGVLLCLWFSTGTALAQVPLQQDPFDQRSGVLNDSLETDSIPEEDILPGVVRIRPAMWLQQGWAPDTLSLDMTAVPWWNPLDTLRGFVQQLGQLAKPYLHNRYGLQSHLLPTGYYQSPLTGHEHLFIRAPEHLSFFDTRTPFVRLTFDQSSFQTQLFGFDIAYNPAPLWLATISYQRTTSTGSFIGQVSDHYNLTAGFAHHTIDNRLVLMASFGWQELSDQHNGGILPTTLSTSDSAFAAAFDPTTAQTAIEFAENYYRMRHIRLDGGLRLLGTDSTGNLLLLAGAHLQDHYNLYKDETGVIYSPADTSFIFRPYGQPQAELLNFSSAWRISDRRVYGGIRLRNYIGSILLQHRATAAFQQLQAIDAPPFYEQNITEAQYGFWLSDTSGALPRIDLRAEGRYRLSNLFGPEWTADGDLTLRISRKQTTLDDSLLTIYRLREQMQAVSFTTNYAPLALDASVRLASLNPSLLEAQWSGPTFASASGLNNQTVLHLRGGLSHQRPPAVRRGVPYEPSHYRIGAFISTVTNPLLRDLNNRPTQPSATLAFAGAELNVFQRLSRFYLTVDATFQTSTASDNALVSRYQNAQPSLYGKLGVFYKNRIFKEGYTVVRVGFQAGYFNAFQPLSFEPAVNTWYPQQAYEVPGYLWLDAIVSAHISRTVAYVRFRHLNEGLTGPGYLTTPFYPMPRAQFSFGVEWRFFD